MTATKAEKPAPESTGNGLLKIERLGSKLDFFDTAPRTRSQYFLRLSRIVAAVVAALKSGAPQ